MGAYLIYRQLNNAGFPRQQAVRLSERIDMKYTEITYKYGGKTCKCIVRECDYEYGDITYEMGVINQMEAITDVGASITGIFQHR